MTNTDFDPSTLIEMCDALELTVMSAAFDAATLEVAKRDDRLGLTREQIAARIVYAASDGQRDVQTLKCVALVGYPFPRGSNCDPSLPTAIRSALQLRH